MVQAGRSSAQALSPLHESLERLDRGKATFRDIGRVWNNQQGILKTHTRLMNQNMHMTHAAGQASQVAAGATTMHGNAVVATGLRMRFFNTLVHEGSRALVNWGKNTQWAGRQVTVGITVPLMLLARTATQAAEEYDAAMVRITKVTNFSVDDTTKAYDKQVAGLERRVDAMTRLGGLSFGFDPGESGGVMAEFAQMGFRGKLLDEMTESTLRLAYVSDSELPDAINLARVSLQAYGEDFRDINEVMARFNIIENNTSLSIAEIAQSLPTVASVASQLNITAAETAGLIAMQKEAGIEASEAAQALRTGLIRLVQAPTDEAIAAFEQVNINLEQMQAENAGDTLGFLQDLGEQFNNVEPGTREMDQFIAAIGKLAGTRQAARLTAVLSEINNITEEGTVGFNTWRGATIGAADALAIYEAEYERLAASASGTAQRLGAAIKVELAAIGEPVLELMNDLRQFVLNILRWFNDLSDGTQKVILAFMGLIAAIGPVGMLMGITANAIGSVGKAVSSLLPRLVTLTSAQQVSKAVTDAKVLSELRNARAMEASAVSAMHAATQEERLAVARAQGGLANLPGRIGRGGARAARSGGSRAGRWLAEGGAFQHMLPRARRPAAMANVGKTLGIASGGAAGGGKAVAGRALGLLGGGATVAIASALVVALKSLVTDTTKFKEAFMDVVSGPLSTLKEAFESLKSTLSNMFDPITRNSEATETMEKISSAVGTFVGWLANISVGALEFLVEVIDNIAMGVTVVVRLIQSLAALLSGDTSTAALLFEEAWNTAIAGVIENLADWMDRLSDLPIIGKYFAEHAEKMREMSKEYRRQRNAAGQARDMIESHAEMTERGSEAIEESRVNGDALIETLRAAGNTSDPARRLVESFDEMDGLIESIIDGEEVLELEMMQMTLRTKEQIRNMLDRNAITQQQSDELMNQVDIMNVQADMERVRTELAQKRLVYEELILQQAQSQRPIAALTAIISQIEELEGEYSELEGVLASLNALTELGAENYAGLNEEQQNAERSANRLGSALRSAMSSIKNEIGTAVTDMLQDQSEAMRKSFQRRQEDLQKWAEDERARIEETHQTKIAALQEEEEKESELEAFRQYAFQQEKARLSYFSSRAAKQINLEVALARGELSQAAILREEMGADKTSFESEQRRNEQSREAELRSKARQEEIDKIEERMETEIESIDEELEAREEALEYEQEMAEAGFEARKKAIERTLEEWKRTNPTTEEEHRRHLRQLESDLGVSAGEWDEIVSTFADNTGTNIEDGFVTAFERAQAQIAEDEKWEDVGKRIAEGIQKGTEDVTVGMSGTEAYERGLIKHSGGSIPAVGGRGLKADEAPIIGQAGEYMIQRKAAKVLGPDMLDSLNNAHRYHSGGEISFEGDKSPSDVGYTLGQAMGHDGATPFAGGTGAVGEALGMGKFSRGGNWPARQWAELSANTRAALNFWRSQGIFPGGIGTGVHRGDPKSDHSYGKALDYMVAPLGQYANREQKRMGWEVAKWHIENPGEFGTKNIIWNGLINSGSGWRPYKRYGDNPGPTLGHYDHVHVSYMHKGGAVEGLDPSQIQLPGDGSYMNAAASTMGVRGFSSNMIKDAMSQLDVMKDMPQLAQGGHVNYDTVAKVHKGETVLTSRLSSDLKDGIKNMGSEPVVIQIENFHGTDDNIEKLATRLETVFKKRDKDRGRKRVMN